MSSGSRWWKVAQGVVGLVVIALAIRYLVRNWSALQTQDVTWRLSPGWLVFSALITWTAYAALVEAWRRVVVSLRQRLSYGDAARITMVSNLGKYVPGKIWAITGAAYLAQQVGVAPAAAIASALVLQALALASGVALVALLAPLSLRSLPEGYLVAAGILGFLALCGVAALTSRRALQVVQRLLPSSVPRLEPVPPATMAMAFLVNAAAWGAYGASFLALVRGVAPGTPLTWSLATSVFATSYLVGLVAAFAPGGVGVRESMFIVLLGGPLGVKLAGGLALASRVMLTITELGAAAPFLLFRRTQGDRS